MSHSRAVQLPQLAWYGDTMLEVDFPATWDVHICRMEGHDAVPLSEEGIREAFRNPIGSRTIRELAAGKKEVAIIFDDKDPAGHKNFSATSVAPGLHEIITRSGGPRGARSAARQAGLVTGS